MGSKLTASLTIAVLFVGLAGGCEQSPESRMKDAMRKSFQLNGKRLAIMYGRSMASPTRPVMGPSGFTGPASEKALQAFIQQTPAVALEEMGITDPNDPALFQSERDHKPFRIRYSVKGPLTTIYPVVCESEGVGGRVQIFKTDGSFVEVPVAEADAYLAGKYDQAFVPDRE
jgi:hypothetical protein